MINYMHIIDAAAGERSSGIPEKKIKKYMLSSTPCLHVPFSKQINRKKSFKVLDDILHVDIDAAAVLRDFPNGMLKNLHFQLYFIYMFHLVNEINP